MRNPYAAKSRFGELKKFKTIDADIIKSAADAKSPVSADVQLYDLIEEVARTPVTSISDIRNAVRQAKTGESLVLKVQRNANGQKRSHLVVVRW